jgi:chromate reductase
LKTVAVLVGSLRRESINRKFAQALAKLAADKLEFRFVEIGDLPHYNDDLWQDPPKSVLRLKQDIESADAVLFVTPEYNRSFPGVLKNAIDWANRPWGKNSWKGKPSAIIGTTPGAIGTAVAQNALRPVINLIDTVIMNQPEVYFTYKAELFAEDGSVKDEKTKEFLAGWVDKFAAWIEKTGK